MIRLGTHAPDYDLTHVSDAFMGQAMYIGSHSYEILNSELAKLRPIYRKIDDRHQFRICSESMTVYFGNQDIKFFTHTRM